MNGGNDNSDGALSDRRDAAHTLPDPVFQSATPAHVLILGAGHAGGSVAAFLRQYGFAGAITLVGEEPHAPYQRPPLSKAWLKGEADEAALQLKSADFYAKQSISLRTGMTATAIDRERRTVGFADGTSLSFDILVIATGARARHLPVPGAELPGVLALRHMAHAEALKATLAPLAGQGSAGAPPRRIAVIGGGYVGLEVAASARLLGAEATVIERESRLLARVACPELSSFYQRVHEAHGVRIELNAGVLAIAEHAGAASGVQLADGRTIPCDAVLVGVGAVPNAELAQAAGLVCEDGIVVDLAARTSDPTIFAVGDVTRRPLPLYRRSVRLESVPNALEQAKQAACAITGRPAPTPEVPWFWSDQYDLKLQIAGIPFDADRILLRGDPAANRFAIFHLRDDVIVAVEAINAPQEFMGGKLLIAAQTPVNPERLRDTTISMKEVAAQPARQSA